MDAHSVLPIETDDGGCRPAMTFVELVGMAADAIGPQTEPVRMAAIKHMQFEPPRRAVPEVRPPSASSSRPVVDGSSVQSIQADETAERRKLSAKLLSIIPQVMGVQGVGSRIALHPRPVARVGAPRV